MDSRKNFVDCLKELIKSNERILNRWIEMKSKQQGFHKETLQLPGKDDLKLFWEGTDVDLLELVTSLHASGAIRSNRLRLDKKELLGKFEALFNIKIKNSGVKLSKARDRKRDVAPFLERLKQVFIKSSESKSLRK